MKKLFAALLFAATFAARADIVTVASDFTFDTNWNTGSAPLTSAPFATGSVSLVYRSPYQNAGANQGVLSWTINVLGQIFNSGNSTLINNSSNVVYIGDDANALAHLPSEDAFVMSYVPSSNTMSLDYNVACISCNVGNLPLFRQFVTPTRTVVAEVPVDVPLPASLALASLGGAMLLASRRRFPAFIPS